MLNEDPLGILSPLTHSVKPEELDLTNPIGNIQCNWQDEYVRLYDPEKDLAFKVKYKNRTEGEVAAEITKIMDYLHEKPNQEDEATRAYQEMMEDYRQMEEEQ